MTTEIYTQRQEEIRLGIVDTQIGSIRRRTVTETTARMYRDGHVGVASAVGDVDAEQLSKQAEQALRFSIPYPPPDSDTSSTTTRQGQWRDTDALVAFAEAVLEPLRRDFPGFVFSNAISNTRITDKLHDDRGRTLQHDRVITSLGLIAKERGSPNIFDTYFGGVHSEMDAEGILAEGTAHLRAFQNQVPLPTPRADGKHKIILRGLQGTLGRTLSSELVARSYAKGSSMFTGRMGETLFHPQLTLVDSRDWTRHLCCPFDSEGTLRREPDCALIKNGVLNRVAVSRRDAQRFSLPHSGSAVGGSSAPYSGIAQMELKPTAPDLRTLLDGQPGLLVWVEAGGDVTRTGDMGAPAMVILRVDADGTVVGRVKPGTLTGNLFEIFGADFVGVTEQTTSPFDAERFVVTHMTLQG